MATEKRSHWLRIPIGILAFAALSFLNIGCSDSTNALNSDTGTLSVSVGVAAQTSATPRINGSGNPSPTVVSDVTITSAKIVLGRIKIKSSMEDTLDFRSDPVVVDLNLSGATQQIGSIQVPVGTYDEFRFRIDDLDSCSALDSCTAGEIQAYEDNPDMRDISIRVEGYVNGNTDSVFVWTTDLDEEQRHEVTPFTIEAGQTVNLVFEFDVTQWFSDGLGGTVDPRTASAESIIEDNLKNAFDIQDTGN